jgi:hypothetical protein
MRSELFNELELYILPGCANTFVLVNKVLNTSNIDTATL